MASRQVNDLFGMLVGHRAKMPSSFSKLDKRGCLIINQGKRRGGEMRVGGRTSLVALHSSPCMPFIIHSKQILFHQVPEDCGKGVRFNNAPIPLIPSAIQGHFASTCVGKTMRAPDLILAPTICLKLRGNARCMTKEFCRIMNGSPESPC